MATAVLPLLLIALGILAPSRVSRMLRVVERPLAWLARRPRFSVAAVGCLAFGLSAALSLLGSMPEPSVHDEFSYLLAADTFAHGRPTNPSHALWMHFESLHILQQPSYASRYPPGQGLLLAVGQLLTGYPIVGAWLGTALACSAILWMLQAWLPPRWAVLGGILAALHPTLLLWGQCYWGGALAACGGALLLGGMRRLMAQSRGRDACWMGLGMTILANTRPFEGLVLSLIACGTLLVWALGRGRPPFRQVALRIVLPLFLVLGPAAAAMAWYQAKVTGDPLRLPHLLYDETYAVAPAFLWRSERPEPVYHHREMRQHHVGWERPYHRQQRTVPGFLAGATAKLELLMPRSLSQLVFQVAVLGLPWLWRDPWMRWGLLAVSVFLLALLTETWMFTHYAAPITALLLVLFLQAVRQLRCWRFRSRPSGLILVRASLIGTVLASAFFCLEFCQARPPGWSVQRAALRARLIEAGGRHLVVVRYGADHSTHAEWVYNGADIDGAAVIWARDMGSEQDRRLLEYFHDRHIWLLEPDQAEPCLMPYPSSLETVSAPATQQR